MYGHVGKVNIQTYVLKRCMLEGTRMRKFRKANIMTSDWGRLPSASEWAFGSAGRSNAVQN